MAEGLAAQPDDAVEAALAAIDAANAEDPNLVDDAGALRPKELVHAERMTAWLERLEPDADDAQRLAARAHHFRRWLSPRTNYPEGRAGYLRWRREARQRHVADVDAILAGVGVDEAVRSDAALLISKAAIGSDPRAQVHEDALCLTFFELQGLSTAQLLGDKTRNVVLKTLRKMSVAARLRLPAADVHPAVLAVVAEIERSGDLDAP